MGQAFFYGNRALRNRHRRPYQNAARNHVFAVTIEFFSNEQIIFA